MRNIILLCVALSSISISCGTQPKPAPVPQPSPVPTVTPDPVPTAEPTPVPSVDPTPVPPLEIHAPFKGDKAFQSYLDSFIKDGLVYGKAFSTENLTVKFGSLSEYGSNVIGLCELQGSPKVTLNESFWSNASATQRKLLAHHELGHCLLYRPHRTDTDKQGNVLSIMYPVIMKDSLYSSKPGYFLEELYKFNGLLEDAEMTHICHGEDI